MRAEWSQDVYLVFDNNYGIEMGQQSGTYEESSNMDSTIKYKIRHLEDDETCEDLVDSEEDAVDEDEGEYEDEAEAEDDYDYEEEEEY